MLSSLRTFVVHIKFDGSVNTSKALSNDFGPSASLISSPYETGLEFGLSLGVEQNEFNNLHDQCD